MPSTLIEIRRQYTHAEECAMIDAVHDALVAAFRIPHEDKHIRLVVHEPHRMATPPDLRVPDAHTLVTVDCIAGRSVDAKRRLYTEVVRRLNAAVDIPIDHVTIVVRDSPPESWGFRGGQAACDLDLGFDVDV